MLKIKDSTNNRSKRSSIMNAMLPIGMGMGVAIGARMDRLELGVAIGLGMGVLLAIIIFVCTHKNRDFD